MRRLRRAGLATALALLAPGLATDLEAATEFIVLGDMPYDGIQAEGLRTGYLGNQIRKAEVPFLVHYGDIKQGEGPCDDDLIEDRRDIIYGLHRDSVFYTPGDNDWTDCDRPNAGSFDELERLQFLRTTFFSGVLPSNPAWRITHQHGYPENAHWQIDSLHLLTLHIVGTDNGRAQILESDLTEALDAVDARDDANLTWLNRAFDLAKSGSAEGLVLFMQADPGELEHRDQRSQACDRSVRTECNPYLTFLEQLTARADAFDKPVLLVHGSTNKFCMDRGFGGWQARKLWRLNGPGDFVTIDAAVVTFDATAVAPFAVRGVLSGIAPADCQGR